MGDNTAPACRARFWDLPEGSDFTSVAIREGDRSHRDADLVAGDGDLVAVRVADVLRHGCPTFPLIWEIAGDDELPDH